MKLQPVAVACVLLVAASAAFGGTAVASSGSVQDDERSANNSSLGAGISTFMQTSSIQTGNEIDREMWAAAFQAAPNRSARQRLVEQRVDSLERKLAALRNETGTTDDPSEAIILSARIESLEQSVNQTAEVVNGSDVAAPKVDELRRSANDVEEPNTTQVAGLGLDDETPERSDRGTDAKRPPGGTPDDAPTGAAPVKTTLTSEPAGATGRPTADTSRNAGATGDADDTSPDTETAVSATSDRRSSPDSGPSYPGPTDGTTEASPGNGTAEPRETAGSSNGSPEGAPNATAPSVGERSNGSVEESGAEDERPGNENAAGESATLPNENASNGDARATDENETGKAKSPADAAASDDERGSENGEGSDAPGENRSAGPNGGAERSEQAGENGNEAAGGETSGGEGTGTSDRAESGGANADPSSGAPNGSENAGASDSGGDAGERESGDGAV